MVLMALLSGCNAGLAPGHESLCPTCVPQSGGETSDFGGGSVCELKEAMPDDRELQSELEKTLAAYARPFERALRWRAAEDTSAPIVAEDTTLRGKIEFDGGVYLADETVECGDLVQVRCRLELETADGSMQATSKGWLTLRRSDAASNIAATSDLSTVHGNLDLRVDSSKPHVGRLSTGIAADADGVSGNVTIEVSYFADRASAEAYARGEQVASTSELRVIGEF